jgi:glucose/mannose transport system permease protein
MVHLGFLADPNFGVPLAMMSVVIAATWQMSGFVMVMYLAGLRAIPEELRDAARVDGATETQVLRHISLPLLRPVTLSAMIILGHQSLKIFDLVISMTRRGPGFATDVPALYMFETTFQGNHFSHGAAISVVMLVAVSMLVIPYLYWSLRREARL